MATYSGLSFSPNAFIDSGNLGVYWSPYNSLFSGDIHQSESIQRNSFETISSTKSGWLVEPRLLSLYQNTITASIDNPNFGTIVSDIYRQITVTNLYGSGVYLNSSDFPVGVNLDISYPYYIPAYWQTGISIFATPLSGDVSMLNESGVLHFSPQDSYIFGIYGNRSVIFKWRPYDIFQERLEFKTEILTKTDGSEQRISSREFPRQYFSPKYMVKQGNELSQFDNTISFWQGKKIIFPIWSEPMITTMQVTAGSTKIHVNTTTHSNISAGGLIALVSGDYAMEAASIASFNSTGIILNSPITFNYPPRIEVLPAKNAYIRQCKGNRLKVLRESKEVEFLVTDYPPRLPGTSQFSSISLKAVVDDLNFIKGSMPTETMQDLISVDSGDGIVLDHKMWEVARKVKSKGFNTLSRAELWKVKGLIYDTKGMWKSFYMPSYHEDFEVTKDIQSAAFDLEVTNVGFSTYIGGVSPYNMIKLTTKTGATYIKTITSVFENNSETETFTMTQAWGVNIPKERILKVELLELTRFNLDNIIINHINARGRAEIFLPTVNTIT